MGFLSLFCIQVMPPVMAVGLSDILVVIKVAFSVICFLDHFAFICLHVLYSALLSDFVITVDFEVNDEKYMF